MENLTVEKGIEIQTRQLNQWKQLLKEEVFNSVQKTVTKRNHLAESGYDIVRGNSIDNIIGNYLYNKEIGNV